MSLLNGEYELGKLYDQYDHIAETHFDFVRLRDRLPEIRRVDQDRRCGGPAVVALVTLAHAVQSIRARGQRVREREPQRLRRTRRDPGVS